MASSNRVLAVVGMLCINRKFRDEFFKDPREKAESLVGALNADELEQITRLAGDGVLPSGLQRTVYVQRLRDAFDAVYQACTCPMPPCPDPDSTRAL